ncbi:MAG: phage integrase SAM-like domain-containing protein [Janthinobacterium lividum]
MNENRSVKLREKKLKDGRISLYLDMYPPVYIAETGKETRREFLKIYLYKKPKTSTEKEINRVSRIKAESIRSERQLMYLNQSFDLSGRHTGKMDFLAYFEAKAKKRNQSKGNYDNWFGTLKYLKAYTKGNCRFSDVTEKFCEGFKEYLTTTVSFKSDGSKLAKNSQYGYFNKFRAAVKEAFEEKLFVSNPMLRVKAISQVETQREYLTFDELKMLYDKECQFPLLKKASIFSALTGLRWSDVIKLTWKEVQHSTENGYFIRFTQQKTKTVETLPIPDKAFEQLGARGLAEEKIFKGLKYSSYNNEKLSEWVLSAGITKHITFHCFRHTYATLLLTFGIEIYTVSKMLGHGYVKTTEIYAKIENKKKIEAANAIKL